MRFFNRELSWIEFNKRVLFQAEDKNNPVLERLKFLGIVSSNFDEFFMVRVGGLTPDAQDYATVYKQAFSVMDEQKSVWHNQVLPSLEENNIRRVRPETLSGAQIEWVEQYFKNEVLSLLTPIALRDDAHSPALINLSLYLMVALEEPGKPEESKLAVIEVPRKCFRMISLPTEGSTYDYILIEDIMAMYVNELFHGFEVKEKGLVRLTRAAEMSIDEEKDEDFAQIMTDALRARRDNHIVRAELSGSEGLCEKIKNYLKIDSNLIYKTDHWIDFKSLSALAFEPVFPKLKNPSWTPLLPAEYEEREEIWDLIKEKDRLVSIPYESFEAFSHFIGAAADDPDVLAIKQTLYRTATNSTVISALERAALKGKQVTVLVELKARFDEQANIEWARRLELAGATVLYGIAGHKTHGKACLVVRRESEGIRRYVHLGTGNYNEKTAKIYSDLGLFTANENIASDLTAFFNVITGYSQSVGFTKIRIAPFELRNHFLRLIEREKMHAQAKQPAKIRAKMNSLVDQEIINALYEAAAQGVEIELNVRGICCLNPALPEAGGRINVISIVDMFLEHSRIFHFLNGGQDEVYLSSADWMPRNFDRRLEIAFPILDNDLRKDLIKLLDHYFKDNTHSWKLTEDGSYKKIEPEGKRLFRVQEFLCEQAMQKHRSQRISDQDLRPQRPKK